MGGGGGTREKILDAFRQRVGASGEEGAQVLIAVLKKLAPGLWSDAELQGLISGFGEMSGSMVLEELLGWILDAQAVGPDVVFVLGGPGSGKGTFSARIGEKFGYRHLSAGDLLRAERTRPGSELGELIESRIKEGKLVPSEVTVRLLEQEMRRQGWDGKYLVDGFPRSLDNWAAWDEILSKTTNLKFCMLIDCSEKVMEERLINRGKTSGRSDDNIETIRKRFVTFKEESLSILEKFQSMGLVRRVCSDPGIDAVWSDVEAMFNEAVGPEVVFVLGGPGCGKGTFSSRIGEQFGYTHLSAGDLLRAERQRPGSEVGELIEARISQGKLVPSEVTIGLLANEMRRLGWDGGRYLVDGFPRSVENFEAWERILCTTTRLRFCLEIECSEEVMEARLLNRGKTSGRSDDNLETIRKRFKTHREESVPILELLSCRGLVRKVNSDPGIDAVWHKVVAIFSGGSGS
eukprot:TRINITY_DN15463_c0_g1_i1.p1 TRINITY_DN15463_c0_g1~~TRINITY_DN15463_c0_g1_i1.p1  ORF type:complete len:462 (+),score=86.35 TRINITY_DN15463_c0_g1_i1:70-1455(+)